MDVIFDIDGTLANASHRLHLIEKEPKDWDAFLSDDQMALDGPIDTIWETLSTLINGGNRVVFITGRPERQRGATIKWLFNNAGAFSGLDRLFSMIENHLYMRRDGDRRPSHIVKEEGLFRAREDGFDPVLVFEDRKLDTEMWRRNGLLCCQVAEGCENAGPDDRSGYSYECPTGRGAALLPELHAHQAEVGSENETAVRRRTAHLLLRRING